jgi:hypothetical protein
VAELGGPDQWQKCLTRKAHKRNGENDEQKGEKQVEVEAAMKGTL